MGKKVYNPKKRAAAEKEIEGDSAAEGAAMREHWYLGIVNFITGKRLRCGIGVLLTLIGVYLAIIFVSYFHTGLADQSLVNSYGIDGVINATPGAKNAGRILGANLAHMFIYRGVGISAFIVVLWCILIGMRLAFMRRVRFVAVTFVSLISVIALSIVANAATLGQSVLFFPIGGYFGQYVNELLVQVAGYPAMVIVSVLLIVIWILVCLTTLKRLLGRIVSALPKWRSRSDGEEETPEEETPEEETPEEEEEATTEDEPDPFDVATEEKKEEDVKPPVTGAEEEEGKIEVAPQIEMASTTTIKAYDPTSELRGYRFPTLDLLEERAVNDNNVDIGEQEENKKRITETLNNYGIAIKRIDACVGPTITLFEIVPADGVRISKIKSLEDDIALSLAALGIRIIAPIPGKGTIGIEVPNKDPQTVSMRSVIGSKKYQESKMELPMALGCTIENKVYMADLAKMPHLLVAGATGQGKSVGLNAIITSLLYKKHPAELKFVLIDPKMVEFNLYAKLAHHYLASVSPDEDPIITDTRKVVATLNSLVQEMEDRYMLLRKAEQRNVKDYNRMFVNRKLSAIEGHRYMPYIVVIIDEFSDLIMTAGKEVERPIVRIAQKARAVGIHMIIATQRPSTNVITGIIKANFPGRIAFRVTQMVDSRTIIDCSGAQQLVGKGDMLFQTGGMTDRVQCAFVDTPEVTAICDYIGKQNGYSQPYELPEYVLDTDDNGQAGGGDSTSNERDSLFEEAAAFIVASDTASTSSLQRRYGIGYNRAGRIMDQLEAAGVVGPSQGGKPRRVLVDSVQLAAILEQR